MCKRNLMLIITIIIFEATLSPALGAIWYWENNHLINLEFEYDPYSDIKDSPGEIQINLTRLRAMVPVIIKDKFFFGLGVKYEGYFFDYKTISPFYHPSTKRFIYQKDLPDGLHMVDLVIGTSYEFSEQWNIYVEFDPGIHSDFEDIDKNDVLLEGLFFFRYTAKSGTEFRFGGGYNHSFGDPQIYPLLGLHCPITEKSAVDVLLPSHAMFRFKVTELIETGLKAELTSREFRLKNGGPWHDDILKYRQITAGPYVEFIIYRSLILRLESGYVFGRKVEFHDNEYAQELWEDELEENLLAGFSVRWAF